jgi:crossover junction endodeoxyribonuclease RuvC
LSGDSDGFRDRIVESGGRRAPQERRRASAQSLRVLGIDPGLTRCGVGIVDVAPNRTAVLVYVGVIRTPPDQPLEQRLLAVARGIEALLVEFEPQAVAVERVFAQHNLRTVMGTAQASGIALSEAAKRGLPVGLHTPSEVKAAITGYGSADKRQVGAMVARVLGLDAVPTPADASDALALAICHAWRGPAAAPRSGALTPAQEAWRTAEKATRVHKLRT